MSHDELISNRQAGELHRLVAERFPHGNDRAYAWGCLNRHFHTPGYRCIPAEQFDDACQFIRSIPPAPRMADGIYLIEYRDGREQLPKLAPQGFFARLRFVFFGA